MTTEELSRPPRGDEGWVDPRVERTRSTALAAARDILLREGWDAVTHVRVAKESGISRPTLYRHWPDTSALLQAAVTSEASVIVPHVNSTGRMEADLRAELEVLRLGLSDPDAFRVLAALVDRAEWDDDLLAAKGHLVEEHLQPIVRALIAGQASGELRSDIDLRVAMSQLVGPLVFRRFLSGEELSAEFVREIADQFLAAAAAPKGRRKSLR